MIPAFAVPQPSLALVLGVGWLLVGAGTGAVLLRRGRPLATAAAALLAWPALLPSLEAAPDGRGPHAARIDAEIAAVAGVLADPRVQADGTTDLDALREALHRADGRIALADRLCAGGDSAGFAALREARGRAAAEVDGVLTSLADLRAQLGVVALRGEVLPIRERLSALSGRVAALDEVSRAA